MKVAIASTKDGVVFPGHFAHAEQFIIYEYDGKELKEVERRENPLGSVPDLDAGHHHGHHHGHMHGVAKYRWLREKVLPDIEAVVAAGACQTSYNYFTSEGVKLLFTDPVEVDTLLDYIRQNPQEFKRALEE